MKASVWWRRISVFNIFLLALGIIFLVSSWQLWRTPGKIEFLGSGGFPLFFSAFWVVGVAILIISEAIKPQTITSHKINIRDIGVIRWLVLVFLTLLYIFFVREAGFVIATIIYEIVLMIAFGATKKRHLVVAIVLAITSTLIIYFAYTLVFKIPVPGVF